MKMLIFKIFVLLVPLIGSYAWCMHAGDGKKVDRQSVTGLTESLATLQITSPTEPAKSKSAFILETPEEIEMFKTIQGLRNHHFSSHKIYEFIRACVNKQIAGASGYSKDALIAFFKKCKTQGFDFAVMCNENRETVLHIAADKGDAYVLMLFMQTGALSCPVNQSGVTPLHNAAFQADERSVRVLIQALLQEKGDINQADNNGMTASHWLTYAANPSNNDGKIASNNSEADGKALRLLLKAKADVMKTDKLGRTPLHWAARNGMQGLVDGLLKYVSHNQFLALLEMQDIHGLTPLRDAEFFKHDTVVVALKTKKHQSSLTKLLLEFLKDVGLLDALIFIIISYSYEELV